MREGVVVVCGGSSGRTERTQRSSTPVTRTMPTGARTVVESQPEPENPRVFRAGEKGGVRRYNQMNQWCGTPEVRRAAPNGAGPCVQETEGPKVRVRSKLVAFERPVMAV